MNKGTIALFTFALLSAGRDVYANIIFADPSRRIDPVFFTFIICAVTFLIFYLVECVSNQKLYPFPNVQMPAGRVRTRILLINAGTLVAYLTTFMAISKVDAYTNALVDYGASPVVTAMLAVVLRSERINASSMAGMVLCLGGIGVLTASLASGSSQQSQHYILGLTLASISCLASSLNNVWNKDIVSQGITRGRAILVRLPLVIIVLGGWILCRVINGGGGLPERSQWFRLILLCIFGGSIPLLLIVYAFEHLEVKNLAFAMFLIPVFTYFGSAFTGVLRFNYGSAVAGVVVLLGVLLSEGFGRPSSPRPLSTKPEKSEKQII